MVKINDYNAIANILWNMSLDMDYADSDPYYSESIEMISDEIAGLSDHTRELLWRIAAGNEGFIDLFKPEMED